ncbi:MAG: hypothetical protein PHQ60_02085 [Sideroxydans sp.]|nr:hypothetical protein [Sideroxydans sp.]MDD5056632.1 hypothetical protein [Sideroxydans sp.]
MDCSTPHTPPKLGCRVTDVKIAALLAACPPITRAIKLDYPCGAAKE